MNTDDKAKKLTKICQNIVVMADWAKTHLKELTTILFNREESDQLFDYDYKRMKEKYNDECSFGVFFSKFDDTNKKKFIKHYTKITNEKKHFVENNIEWCNKLNSLLYSSSDWALYLDYDMSKPMGNLRWLYENRLASYNVSNLNKAILYDYVTTGKLKKPHIKFKQNFKESSYENSSSEESSSENSSADDSSSEESSSEDSSADDSSSEESSSENSSSEESSSDDSD